MGVPKLYEILKYLLYISVLLVILVMLNSSNVACRRNDQICLFWVMVKSDLEPGPF